MKSEELKLIVKKKYGEIVNQSKEQNFISCCGATGCSSDNSYTIFSESYDKLDGYNPDADLGLGCGIPTEFVNIEKGDTVVDLGSGAGNDCFVARSLTGESGKVIGIDFTEAMIEKARINNDKLGFNNVEFRLGDIEKIPMPANCADVIVSNCVLNLVPDKNKAFNEIYRVLKPEGHFSISDIVLRGNLPDNIKQSVEMYAGCISGAIDIDQYLKYIKDAGFINIQIRKEKKISVPDEILLRNIDLSALDSLKKSGTGIYSITVYAEKPPRCGCADYC